MIIQTEDLQKRFRRHSAVNGITLSVPHGATLALVGANGVGKTTLLRLLVNILRPDGGSARVLGVDSRSLAPADFQRIGYVSENQRVPERLTVSQYFGFLRTLYANWDRALERELLAKLDLPPERRLGKLSHGMRIKTLLAGVLAFRPALLILDEPLSGLDPLMRDEIIQNLLRQADETTIVISSHELAEIEGFTTHVAYLDKGRVSFQESVEQMQRRFREVSVVLASDAVWPTSLPARCLNVETAGRSVRFVDSGFTNESDLRFLLHKHLGSVASFEAQPMTLREISKTLLLASRTGVQA